MVDLIINPRHSVGPFKLGFSRDEIRAAAIDAGIPVGQGREDMDLFLRNSVQVSYARGFVDFIGVSTSIDYRAFYRGVDISDISAKDLFQMAADADESGPHIFNEFEYCFPNQILTLWEVDEQYDRSRRRFGGELRPMWAQVGIGTPGYLEAIRKIDEDMLRLSTSDAPDKP
ncbi:MAG: hypothetical protein HIU91_14790 [Acidobacteria bacterium]|nr:hypothetical protein [Acidobacteriota bacterium]